MIPFPTTTPGHVITGRLAPRGASESGQPAQAVLPGQRATPTPDREACPTVREDAELDTQPADRDEAAGAIVRYLSSGGDSNRLADALRRDWRAYNEESYLREDADLTGEDEPEIVLGYLAPGDVGTLLVFGCVAGRYELLYQAIADGSAPPRLIWLGDMNNDFRDDLVIASRVCESAQACEYATQVVTWDTTRHRFVNLLDERLLSIDPPEVRDIDDDEVAEVVVELQSSGNAATGPLRTGVLIYDWNGSVYTLSIKQLDEPRYRIQYVHAGDRSFSRLEMDTAADLYTQAIADEGLRYWFNDGPETVGTYARYRLLLAYAFSEDPRLQEVLLQLNTDYPVTEETPLEAQPVYVHMSYVFTRALEITGDLHSACTEVLNVVEARPEALELLNRYGSRSPTYTALELCPY